MAEAKAQAGVILKKADEACAERMAAVDGVSDESQMEWRKQLHMRLSRIDTARDALLLTADTHWICADIVRKYSLD